MEEKTKRKRISDECNHQYSKEMNQPFPRKCTLCGEPEYNTNELKSAINSYAEYFELCDELDNELKSREEVAEIHDKLQDLEDVCKNNLSCFREFIKEMDSKLAE